MIVRQVPSNHGKAREKVCPIPRAKEEPRPTSNEAQDTNFRKALILAINFAQYDVNRANNGDDIGNEATNG